MDIHLSLPEWRRSRTRSIFIAAAVSFAGSLMLNPLSLRGEEEHRGFNKKGNILIADQFNNRVIEIDRHHKVVWQFGDGSSVPGPHSVVGTNDAERVGRLTLISGTGTPPDRAAPSPAARTPSTAARTTA